MFSNKFIQRFIKACQIVILTGDGLISKDETEAIVGNNNRFDEFSRIDYLKNNEDDFWKRFISLRKSYARLKPNLGHYALVDLENRYDDFALITTAIDGIHEKAGNKKLIEFKGNIGRNICLSCGFRFSRQRRDDPPIPHCPECGGNVRPDVLLSDETMDKNILEKAQIASAECELFLTVCLENEPREVEALPLIAKANGAYLLEINNHETALSKDMNEVVVGNPAKLLTALVFLLEKI